MLPLQKPHHRHVVQGPLGNQDHYRLHLLVPPVHHSLHHPPGVGGQVLPSGLDGSPGRSFDLRGQIRVVHMLRGGVDGGVGADVSGSLGGGGDAVPAGRALGHALAVVVHQIASLGTSCSTSRWKAARWSLFLSSNQVQRKILSSIFFSTVIFSLFLNWLRTTSPGLNISAPFRSPRRDGRDGWR